MNWGFYNIFSQQILEPFSFLTQIAEVLVTLVMPIIGAVLVIKVMAYGYEVLRGQVSQNVLLELVFRNLRPMMVISLALAGGAYAANIVPMVEELRTALTSLFTQAPATNSYAALDLSMNRVMDTYFTMTNDAWENRIKIGLNELDLTGLMIIGCANLMVIALLLYSTLAAAQLLVIDVMFKVLLAIGPIFIAAFVFPATARFFDSWLSTVLRYIVTSALVMLVVCIGTGIFDHYTLVVKNSEAIGAIGAAFYSVAASGLLIYFTLKVPSLAGDMLGGGGVSVFSPASAVNPAATALKNAAHQAEGRSGGSQAGSGSAVMREMVNRATRSSGVGSISGANAPQAHFPRSRGMRPAGQSIQSMLVRGK